jgi:LuxR family maltose regulon positive regulatory protein
MAFALNGRWEEAESLLDVVEKAVGSELRSDEVLVFSYLVASQRQDRAWLDKIAAQAEVSAQHDLMTKVVLALLLSVKGDLRRACQLLSEAQESGERDSEVTLALTALFHQCRLQVFQGNLQQAHALCQQALERIHVLGNAVLPMATFAHSSLGRILIEWNELEKADEHLREAIRLGERSGLFTGVVSSATMMLAEVQQGMGDSSAANRIAEEAMHLAERYDPAPEVIWLKTYRARLWLTQGKIAAADVWMQDTARKELPLSLFYPVQIQDVTEARALLARRKTDEAIALLTGLTKAPQHLLTVEVLALLALARQANGDSVNALLTLEQALALGAAENRIRVFLDLGVGMAKLVARFCEAHPDNDFARKLLAAFPVQGSESLAVEALSEREIEVLRLIVAGQSNDEIAETLTLAVSTVKWYINVLYGKLHVKTRSQAIARAHELKLV